MKTTLDLHKLLKTRNRPKFKLTAKDLYELYPRKEEISYEDFVQICKTFNHLFMRSIIETGNIYRVPQRLGRLSVRKRKGKYKRMDVIHYYRTGEKVYHANRHSEGYYARFDWEKDHPYMMLTKKSFYKLNITRFHKRYLSSGIKERNLITKYYEHG